MITLGLTCLPLAALLVSEVLDQLVTLVPQPVKLRVQVVWQRDVTL